MTGQLLTFRDAYEHLSDVFEQEGKAVGALDRKLQRAVQLAYQKLPSLHDWAYFRGSGSINTSLPANHTIVYTASTGRVTIATGTWDADAVFGAIVISNTRYEVSRRISDTEIELTNGPAADYAGASRWQRFRYLLPEDVGDVSEIVDANQYFDLRRVTVKQTWWWQQVINAETYPLVWSLYPSQEVPGRWEIWLSGSGQVQRSLTYLYRRRFTNLSVLESLCGADTVTISDDEATFSSPILATNMVDTVLRISSTASHPTGYLGRRERNAVQGTSDLVTNPPVSEHVIKTIQSTTIAILKQPTADVTAKGYSISSHIDLNYEIMWELFLRLAEEQYDIITRAEGPIRKLSAQSRMEALRSAMFADAPGPTDQHVNRWRGDVILEG
jgi:hypothetical protein